MDEEIGHKGVYALNLGRVAGRTSRGPLEPQPYRKGTAKGSAEEDGGRRSGGRKVSEMEYKEHWVPRGRHLIYTREYGSEGPAVVLMHGFPDNLHLYDRLMPHLSGRRVVAFDFLGWGESDKPAGYPYTADNQTRDLDAVIRHLGLEDVVLVAHDASGPPAIDWARCNRSAPRR